MRSNYLKDRYYKQGGIFYKAGDKVKLKLRATKRASQDEYNHNRIDWSWTEYRYKDRDKYKNVITDVSSDYNIVKGDDNERSSNGYYYGIIVAPSYSRKRYTYAPKVNVYYHSGNAGETSGTLIMWTQLEGCIFEMEKIDNFPREVPTQRQDAQEAPREEITFVTEDGAIATI